MHSFLEISPKNTEEKYAVYLGLLLWLVLFSFALIVPVYRPSVLPRYLLDEDSILLCGITSCVTITYAIASNVAGWRSD